MKTKFLKNVECIYYFHQIINSSATICKMVAESNKLDYIFSYLLMKLPIRALGRIPHLPEDSSGVDGYQKGKWDDCSN